MKPATSAMPDDTLPPFPLPAIKPKKVIAAFDGGRLSSDGGVALLALAEKRVGIIDRLSGLFPDERDPERVTHPLGSIIGARVFAIGCGYEDGNDLDHLRKDPAFKLACGRLPDSGHDLCSQSTISRLENAPSLRDAVRLTYSLIDQWCASDPHDFSLDRRPSPPHMNFGGGAFSCIGQYVAVIEVEEAIAQLANRYPKLRVTHAERDFTAMFQSLKTLDMALAV